MVYSSNRTGNIHSVLLIALFSLAFSLSPPARGISCYKMYLNIQDWLRPGLLPQAKSELPELGDFYSTRIQITANELQKKFQRNWKPRSRSENTAMQSLQPFLDIEKAIQTATTPDASTSFSVEGFGKMTLNWKQSEEIYPFLYTQLPRFGAEGPALLKWLQEHHPAFRGTFIQGDCPTSLVTFSFEKETHSPQITHWYRPRGYSDESWLQLSAKERAKKLWGTLAKTLGIVPTQHCPTFLGDATRELQMREYNGSGFNYNRSPIETSHKKFEIQLEKTFDEMQQVSHELGEESAFHLHESFAFPKKDVESFRRFVRWWKKVNDYNYLHGLEEGLHPNQLTKLPKLKDLPSSISQINILTGKYNGVGLRKNIYGPAQNRDYVQLGIELRDTNRTLKGMKIFARKLANSIQDRIWDKEIEHEPLPLDYSSKELLTAFSSQLRALGATRKEIKLILKLEPLLVIPLNPFANYAETAQEKTKFAEGTQHYLKDLMSTLHELREYSAQRQKVENDLLRSALRTSLSHWAKHTNPSALYSNF